MLPLSNAELDTIMYTQCKHCDHFVEQVDGGYMHLDDGMQEYNHDAEPGEKKSLLTWKTQRPDLHKQYPDGKTGPNSEYHSQRGKATYPSHVRVKLIDKNNVVVEQGIYPAWVAAEKARKFVWLQGGDPDMEGQFATAGSVEFTPTTAAVNEFHASANPPDTSDLLDLLQKVRKAFAPVNMNQERKDLFARIDELLAKHPQR